MTTKEAAKRWSLTENTVKKYCIDKKIPDIQETKNGTWEIPDGSIKPLKEYEIKRVLLLTLQLKNNPNFSFDWSTYDFDEADVRKVYDSLVHRKYINSYDIEDNKRIPYEAQVTEKGINLFSSKQKEKIDIPNVENIIAGLTTIITSISTIISCK